MTAFEFLSNVPFKILILSPLQLEFSLLGKTQLVYRAMAEGALFFLMKQRFTNPQRLGTEQ
jgi:hypothetical protein